MMNKDFSSSNVFYSMKKSLGDLPTPSSISFLWNIGFLLGMTLCLQILSGLFLSMVYSPSLEMAFENIVMIMRDVNMGWISRIIHMNGASLFFCLIYMHIARGMYFSSPSNQPLVWISGILILLFVMGIAFLGYVLPWGQMSFWGATVITGVISAIPILGQEVLVWVWGGPSVANPTLNRFFSLHFVLPFLVVFLVLLHLIFLHEKGSSNQFNSQSSLDKVKFYPFLFIKDLIPVGVILFLMILLASNSPNFLGDTENFNVANPLNAPVHIQPEWYFLFAYAILRSIPSKLGGVISLGASVLIILILIFKKSKTTKFNMSKKLKFWFLVSIFFTMTWIGSKGVEFPFEKMGKIYTLLYFSSILSL